jgi:DNA polymerase-4
MRRWNCCAIRSCAASRWSSAAAGDTSPRPCPTARVDSCACVTYTGRGVDHGHLPGARPRRALRHGLMKAAQRAPDCILLPTDFERYREYSRRFKAAVAEIAPLIEDRGIDEIYIDLSAVPGAQDASATTPPGACAHWPRRSGTTCARHRPDLLDRRDAEQAAVQDCQRARQARRPDGAHRWPSLSTRIWPLAVRRVNGIGPKAGARLEALGIRTVGDLAACERDWLVEHFGRAYGRWLHDAATASTTGRWSRTTSRCR